MLQPEQDTPGQSRKTTAQETAKTGYLCAISRQGRTYPESFDITYKEGVAGSNPASPTQKKYSFARKTQNIRKSRVLARLLLTTTWHCSLLGSRLGATDDVAIVRV